jgi:hypothetical protein
MMVASAAARRPTASVTRSPDIPGLAPADAGLHLQVDVVPCGLRLGDLEERDARKDPARILDDSTVIPLLRRNAIVPDKL